MKVSSLRNSHIAFWLAAVLTTGTPKAAEPGEIRLVLGGKQQEMSAQAQVAISDRLPKLFATCSLNSRDHPRIFVSWGLTTIWEDAEAKDHLRVQLRDPIVIHAGARSAIPVQQFLLALDNPQLPGPELSRHEERVVAYTKCSGYEVIRFVCAAEVKVLMPSSYHRLCRYLAQSEQGDAQPVVYGLPPNSKETDR